MIEEDNYSGVRKEIENLDSVYYEIRDKVFTLGAESCEIDKDLFEKLIAKSYTDGEISSVPTCALGHLRGERHVGKICPICNTPVVSDSKDDMYSKIWLKVPDEAECFLHPVFVMVTQAQLGLSKEIITDFDSLRWICDPHYLFKGVLTPKNKEFIKAYNDTFKERGLPFFKANFDDIIVFLEPFFNKASLGDYYEFVSRFKHLFFPKHLPTPSPFMLAMEKTNDIVWAQKLLITPINEIRNFYSLSQNKKRNKRLISKVSNYIFNLVNFIRQFEKERMQGKPGVRRHNIFGGRLDFSSRAVISSIIKPHYYEELHIPWVIAVLVFEVHIRAILLRDGYTIQEIDKIITNSIHDYHPVMDRVLVEIVESQQDYSETFDEVKELLLSDIAYKKGYHGTIFNRNPTLKFGSIKKLRITYVKGTNNRPELVKLDGTVSLSPCILATYNADFDGDAMHKRPLNYGIENKLFEVARPHYAAIEYGKPFDFNEDMKLEKEILSTLCNWMEGD